MHLKKILLISIACTIGPAVGGCDDNGAPPVGDPVLEIISHADGDMLDLQSGEEIIFRGILEGGDYSADLLIWESDLDGELGMGEAVTTTLSEGTHVITLTLLQDGEQIVIDTITIEVTIQILPPTGWITAPEPIWSLKLSGSITSAPTFSDLDGDGETEVIVVTIDGDVYAIDRDGETLPGWPFSIGSAVSSSPTAADPDTDGEPEIIIGAENGDVYVLDAYGNVEPGWPYPTGCAITTTPAAGYSVLEPQIIIVVASRDGKIHLIDKDGGDLPGWPQTIGGSVSSSPATVNYFLLGNTSCGTEFYQAGPMVISGSDDGTAYLFASDGSLVSGWPVATGGEIHNSPAQGDLDGDGCPEFIIASNAGKVYAFNYDGTAVSGWPYNADSTDFSDPVVGDIHGDENLEVAFGTGDGEIIVLDHVGAELAGWPMKVGDSLPRLSLADIDGDAIVEILFSPSDGILSALNGDATPVPDWPIQVTGTQLSPVSITGRDPMPAQWEATENGIIDNIIPKIAVGTSEGHLHLLSAISSPYNLTQVLDWPQYQKDGFNSGLALPWISMQSSPDWATECNVNEGNPCFWSGCSREVCVSEPVFTACLWMSHYQCFDFASCACYRGNCTIFLTEEMIMCLFGITLSSDSSVADLPTIGMLRSCW